jgi:chromosome segregation ATPase
MSPQRQVIVHAIRNGHCTPKSIGHFVGKPHKTISKLLYLMEKDGVIGKVGYGKYQVIDSSIELKKPLNIGITQSLDNKIDSSITVSRIESIEQRLSSVETWQKQYDKPPEVPIDNLETIDTNADLESKIKALETENEALKVRLDDKEGDEVARINELGKEKYALQAQINDLRGTIDDLKSENEAIKRTHAKDKESVKHEQDKLVESIKSKNRKLQAQVEQLQAQIKDSQKEAQPLLERNADLESKIEAIQKEAQANIDSLTQKLSEANQEIARQSTEYNELHKKYTALKVDVDDGEAPSAKSTKRKPLTLDSDAKKASVNDVTIEINGQQIVVPDGQVPENRNAFIDAVQRIFFALAMKRQAVVDLLNANGVKTLRGKKFSNDILRKSPFNC